MEKIKIKKRGGVVKKLKVAGMKRSVDFESVCLQHQHLWLLAIAILKREGTAMNQSQEKRFES